MMTFASKCEYERVSLARIKQTLRGTGVRWHYISRGSNPKTLNVYGYSRNPLDVQGALNLLYCESGMHVLYFNLLNQRAVQDKLVKLFGCKPRGAI